MINWLIRNRLAAFEKKFEYDMTYARDILAADRAAFFAFAKLMKMSEYRKGVPRDPYFAAKLVGTLTEDCGPCTQLAVTMGLDQGADPKQLAAVIAKDVAVMSDDVKLAVSFARTSLAHDPEADNHRDEIVKRWGPQGLVSLAFAIAAARVYPTLKYALGHGKTCQRVVVAGKPVAVVHDAA